MTADLPSTMRAPARAASRTCRSVSAPRSTRTTGWLAVSGAGADAGGQPEAQAAVPEVLAVPRVLEQPDQPPDEGLEVGVGGEDDALPVQRWLVGAAP